ncbi:hypothetical protein DCS_03532 [Drechmeria coniospora]|uniref:Uncharacterized protein n=1 Tax=Drechmeria coniospora TaxID=98403 RepID=A0A151GHL7_DRECN|nr:hypothetical protein DCS_03532 [Drechmeria coniospora]KYK56532.1 hypothetical protein DCS_03532 [Drechmeria coniospora]ODA76970.1 hypothetical protein RJ55_07487 [Drechmeria coniospora]
MVRLVSVALHHRDRFSEECFRKTLGYQSYHWGIIIMPQEGQGQLCHTFEATDASEIDPVTFRLQNPTMDWWMRSRLDVHLELSGKLLGRIVIGQVPEEMSTADLKDVFDKVPLPVKDTHPQQSCVTWAVDAIRHLQRLGWVSEFQLDQFMDSALAYGHDRMLKDGKSTEPKVKYYSVEQPQ